MTATTRLLRAAVSVKRHEHGIHRESLPQLKKFSAALVTRRTELDISRRALSAFVGISYGQLSHIENAENWPTMPVYLKLVDALKCGKVPLL